MRILVWGATPIAGWTAGRLHQLGHDTLWLANEQIQHDIERTGGLLTLSSPQRTAYVKGLSIGSRIDAMLKPPLDWIMLLMPTWAIGDAVREMSRRIPPSKCPPLVVLGTGVGALEKVGSLFPPELAIGACSTRQFEWPTLRDGTLAYETIVSDGVGGVALTENERTIALADILARVGFGESVIAQQEALEWSSLLWHLQTNALPTLLRVQPDMIYASRDLFTIEYRQLREALTVIDQKQIQLVDLPGVAIRRLGWQIRLLPENLLRLALQGNAKQKPSLMHDFAVQSGRSDAAYLNGIIAKEANDLKIKASVNYTLAVSLTDIAEGRAVWEQYTVNYLTTLLRIADR